MTSAAHHQPQSSFAPPHLQGSVAKAGGHSPSSSLGCLPAPSINHAQMYGDRQAGARLWGQCDRHAPVRVNFVRGQGSNFLLTTGRGFGLGALSADGRGCSPVVAINIKSTRCGISKRLAQRDPSHRSSSSWSSTYASKTIQKRRRGLGKVIRELGPVVQGVAHE